MTYVNATDDTLSVTLDGRDLTTLRPGEEASFLALKKLLPPSESPIFEAALEALQEQERQRIQHMREGIAAARGGTANPSESEQG